LRGVRAVDGTLVPRGLAVLPEQPADERREDERAEEDGGYAKCARA
jgi:hypothetical protein